MRSKNLLHLLPVRNLATPRGWVYLWLLCFCATLLPAEAWAKGSSTKGLRVHAQTLQHRSAEEAVTLVRPLLSVYGTVEEQGGTNTLVIRDLVPVIHRVKEALAGFDRPPNSVQQQIIRK